MTMMNTSPERIDALMTLSDKVYPVIDEEIDGQTRAKRIVRLGITATADALKTGTIRLAGDRLHSFILGELSVGGLGIDDPAYDAFPSYRSITAELPRISTASTIDPLLDELAANYADVQRATISRDGSLESDASHAVHLAAIALPYAAEQYPHLEQSKIAIYCLIHDLVEAYVGDVPSLGVSDDVMAQKHQAEQQALQQLKEDFGTKYEAFVQLVFDYENLVDDEARFVKTFDKLDPGFTHFYSEGRQLTEFHGITSASEFFSTVDQTTRRMQQYATDFLSVLRDREELTLRIAEQTDWPM